MGCCDCIRSIMAVLHDFFLMAIFMLMVYVAGVVVSKCKAPALCCTHWYGHAVDGSWLVATRIREATGGRRGSGPHADAFRWRCEYGHSSPQEDGRAGHSSCSE